MNWSLFFQIMGSLCVFVGYWLNSKNHPRQHQLFIFGHVFLITFTVLESKVVLFFLSLFIIIMQYRISRRKYKFKKDIVRMKKVAKIVKPGEMRIHIKNGKSNRNESKRVSQKGTKVG